MNREAIIRMAREAGIVWGDHTVVGSRENLLECFASLVAAAEREECAKVCDGWPDYDVQGLAESIRARGERMNKQMTVQEMKDWIEREWNDAQEEEKKDDKPQITHAENCWSWGPAHYECACAEIAKMKGWKK
jgi:hypothetical protein